MPQDKQECKKCFATLTDETKIKNKKLCKECNKILCREYKEKHKDLISLYNKEYKAKHKQDISKYNHDYNISHREIIQKRHTQYLKEKRLNDINYRIATNSRNRIKKLLKNINTSNISSIKLLGCKQDFLIDWLKYNLKNDMTFENYGSYWHIDHVIPCKYFNLENDNELKKCFSWVNLQPLKASVNLSKQAKIDINEINNHWQNVINFIKIKKIEAPYILSDYRSYITTFIM